MKRNKPKQYSNAQSNTINSKWKAQRVKKERCKHKITLRCVIKEEIKVLGEKPLCSPPNQNDPLMNKVGVQGYQKDPSSLICPMYLNPLSFSSQQSSPSHVFTNYSNSAISSKLHLPINGFFQCFPHAPNSPHLDWVRYVFGLRTS